MPKLKIAQAPPSLLPPEQKASGPPPTVDAQAASLEAAKPAYSEDWTRSIIRYFCNLAAAEWGPEMAATEIEIMLLTPALQAVLNRHAPDVASGADERSSLIFVGVVILVMGARRGLVVRRKLREEAARKRAAADQAPLQGVPAPPSTSKPTVVQTPAPTRSEAKTQQAPAEPRGVLMGGTV